MQTQGGIPTVPTLENPLILQPQPDPTHGPKAPFALQLGGALFGGVFDSVLAIGYNPATSFSTTEPQVVVSMEQDFNNGGGTESTEFHINMGTSQSNGSISTRLLTSAMNRSTGSCGIVVQFRSLASDPIAGSFSVQDVATGTVWMQVLGNSNPAGSDYLAQGPVPATIGAIRTTQGADGNPGITARAALGAYDLRLMATDAVDQMLIGDRLNGAGNDGVTNVVVHGRTVAQGGSALIPANTDDMGLGSGVNRWLSLFAKNVIAASGSFDSTNGLVLEATAGALSVAGGSFALSAAEAATPIIRLTGVLPSNIAITIPNVVGSVRYFDCTTVTFGAFFINFWTGSGTATFVTSTFFVGGKTMVTVVVTTSAVTAVS